ncbi:MAG: SMC-Scp complex subunit ScpB [Candidatus Kryptoniota bacterium]
MSEQQYPDGSGDKEENKLPQDRGTPNLQVGFSLSDSDAQPAQTTNYNPESSSELDIDLPPEESAQKDNVKENAERRADEENLHRDSLDGLDEIVKPDDEKDDSELSPKEGVVDDLAHIIEAILFASDEPLNAGTIKSVLDAAHTFGRVNPDMIVARIDALNKKYELDGSGFYIIEIANGYQFATRKELAQWVSYLFKEKARRKLSNSALETLAIIAYKQPITKPEVETIRGVNVDYVLHNLLEKEIVTVVGRAETVGRPLLYGTTQRFLKIFALKNLEDLPKLREIEEIIKEIRSKGAEESIQLEITAFGGQPAAEPANEPPAKQEIGPAEPQSKE